MVPQEQGTYYALTPGAPALPLYQTSPFQFPQQPHASYMQSVSPASASETLMYGQLPHPAAYVGTCTPASSVPPSCEYPSSTHHSNFAHSAGSEHAPASFSNDGVWQGQAFPPSSSPPPPAYPPGFEPKQNNASISCTSSNVAMGNPCIKNSHPHPHLNLLPHQHQGQHHQRPVPILQPPHLTPHPHWQHLQSSQTACSTFHGYNGSRTVIGVPVMGTPVYVDAVCVAPPPAIPHGQQLAQTWQPKYRGRPGSSETRQQSSKSTFHLTKYFQRNGSHSGTPKGARKVHQNAWQPPNSQASDSLFSRDYSSPNAGHTFAASETNYEHLLPPPTEETQQLCMDTSSVRNLDHKQLPPTIDNLSLEHRLLRASPRELGSCANGRQLPNTCRDDQPQSNQDISCKAGPAKENCISNAQKLHINGQQKLNSCRFRELQGNLHYEGIARRSDGQPLRCNPCERSSIALAACSEAQFSSHVKCEQKGCSPEKSGEEQEMGSASTSLVDNKASALPSVKSKDGLIRWLEERKNNYPTPANVLRKAEERKKREEMGEFVSDKPISRRPHIRNGFTTRYDRHERLRIDKSMEVLGQLTDKSKLKNTESRDEAYNCERKDLADSYLSTNGSEMPHEIEDSGPVGSPLLELQVSDFEKGVKDAHSQSILTSAEITKQNNIDRTLDPGNAWLFRRKRRKQRHNQITLVAQRQKKLLFRLLNRDIEKESSQLLQCCRFIVNNHFLQDLSPLNGKHFEWVEAAKRSSVDDLSADGGHITESSPFPNGKDIIGLGKIVAGTQDVANEKGKECSFKGEDKLPEVSQSAVANVQNLSHVHVLIEDAQHVSESPLQELSCSNKEQELIEDARHASVAPLQEVSCSNKEQGLITEEAYSKTGSQPCHQNDIGQVHFEFNSTSDKSVVDRSVDGAESSALLESSCSRYEREAAFPWKHLDCYLDQRNTLSGFTSRHYDCIREPFLVNGLIIDGRHAPVLLSSSNLDAQGPPPFLWEQLNTDSHLPNHDMDTGVLDSGICDSVLDDDDDISQYMNLDAFETDSGMCYG